MAKTFNKFLLLIWKNFLHQRRNPIQTIVEILAPTIFSVLLVIVRCVVYPTHHSATFYDPFENKMPLTTIFKNTLVWSPNSFDLNLIVNETVNAINADKRRPFKFKHHAFNTSADMEKFLSNEIKMVNVLAGIQFDDSLSILNSSTLLPHNVNITFRFPAEVLGGSNENWKTNNIFPVYEVNGPRNIKLKKGGYPSYYLEGFLTLQQELSFSFINYYKNKINNSSFDRSSVPVYMRRFPYPKFTEDMLVSALLSFVGLIFMLSFVYTCINIVKAVTTEKENQLKELMVIMGLPNWLHWTAWFVTSLISLIISISIMIGLLKIKWYPGSNYTVFTYSDSVVIFLFLLLYACSTITFCFLISVFFSKANTAATIAGLAWFLTYFPYMATQGNFDSVSFMKKILMSFCSNTAMAYGFHLMVLFEANEEGLQWYNIWKTPRPDQDLTVGHILVMLSSDSILYLLIALYIEKVLPGEFGIPKPWYFPFQVSYWFKPSPSSDSMPFKNFSSEETLQNQTIHLEVGIEINELEKVFAKNKAAVKNLNLSIYKNQITALLGHNGAGKSTTMSMIMGMIPPTAGSVIVNGYDIATSIEAVRQNLGLCLQHNVLFDKLTVKEHIYFFSRLKDLDKSLIEDEVNKYITILELTSKADALTGTLSGGMKRKLSVGIALCGNSKIVVLDEPTAGMDPSARRTLWDLLQSEKLGRTILFATHFMDEADLLGDRIAIMADGNLQCCGSGFFLKNKYGTGYHMVIDKQLDCDVEAITKLFQNYIPNIKVKTDIGHELTYELHKENVEVFEDMLTKFETKSSSLGVSSYGISLTTLEEVFMKVGGDPILPESIDLDSGKSCLKIAKIMNFNSKSSNKKSINNSSLNNNNSYQMFDTSNNYESIELINGWRLLLNQLLAMFMKKGLYLYRSWILTIIQIIIPSIYIFLAIIIMKDKFELRNLPNLKIGFQIYFQPVTVMTRYLPYIYSENYIHNLRNRKLINWEQQDFEKNIISKTQEDPRTVHYRYIVGATFHGNNTITAWFNNQAYHSAPLTLQLVLNSILQTELNSTNYSIGIYNKPLPFSVKTKISNVYQLGNVGFQIAFNIGFSMAFVSAFYIMFNIKERVCKFKHLQFIAGVNVITFWLPSYICDVMLFALTSLLTVFTVYAFQQEGFSTFDDMGRLFSILIIFGFCVLPMMYLFSYYFDIPSTGYTKITLINIFTGIAAFILVNMFRYPTLGLQNLSNIFHWIFIIIPHYSLSSAVLNLNEFYMGNKVCGEILDKCVNTRIPFCPNITVSYSLCKTLICIVEKKCCSPGENYYEWNSPGVGKNITFLLIFGMLLTGIILLNEFKVIETVLEMISKKSSTIIIDSIENCDSDVLQEKNKVNEIVFQRKSEIPSYNLLVHNVTKCYNNFVAVNNLSLAVNEKECFGLLGINGAGKTTTFKMLTGDLNLSSGDVWIAGLYLGSKKKSIYQNIGYCPQFDALLEDLTCFETLIMFGLLRGITRRHSASLAKELANRFDFSNHLYKKVKQLSGGNKRKLSTAIAFIGNPKVVYLDEPSTGMDPVTKLNLWKALCQIRNEGTCIILTSHSMEECETLCTRIAIMVNGELKCLGTSQHLKTKFSNGFTLTVKIKKETDERVRLENLNNIEIFAKQYFINVLLREKHEDLLTFYITNQVLPWSKMFGIMERSRQLLNIEDYSIGQCTLEQVFLSFTKYQKEDNNS